MLREASESARSRSDRTAPVCLDVGAVRFEPNTLIDAPGRVRGLGDDHPAVTAVGRSPPCGYAEQMGSETAPPVVHVGEDVLVAAGVAASNDPETRDQHAVGEAAEIRRDVKVGNGALRFASRSNKSGVCVGPRVPCPLVLRDGKRAILLPIVAGQAPDAEAVRSHRLMRQGGRHEHFVNFEIELVGRPSARLIRHSRQADRDPRGDWKRRTEDLHPALCIVSSGRIGHQDEITPVIGRICRRPDDEMIAAIVHARAGEGKHRDISTPTDVETAHIAIVNRASAIRRPVADGSPDHSVYATAPALICSSSWASSSTSSEAGFSRVSW